MKARSVQHPVQWLQLISLCGSYVEGISELNFEVEFQLNC